MAHKVYRAVETALTFKDSGGDVVISLLNLAAGAGRVSARVDRGAGSKPTRYKVRAVVQFETAPIVGEQVEVYIAESDGTYADGVVGAADAALTSGQKSNLGPPAAVTLAQTTGTGTDFVASGIVDIYDRYFSVAVWNGSAGDNLKNTANACVIILTPMPDEIQ